MYSYSMHSTAHRLASLASQTAGARVDRDDQVRRARELVGGSLARTLVQRPARLEQRPLALVVVRLVAKKIFQFSHKFF